MRGASWLGAACVLALAACAQGAPRADAGGGGHPAAGDKLRGMVEVVGSEPATSIALLMDGGARAVTLEGASGGLRQVQGLEVTVWGEEARPGVFRVVRFAVRAMRGIPSVDGVLGRDGDAYVLVTTEGTRIPIARLPEALRGRVGSRVWLAGPPHREVDTYGVIEPRR
jgi:hypothetical protein